ncbi:MAG: hydrogenase iron-sulfur subunit [Pseudomonadota bacterium]
MDQFEPKIVVFFCNWCTATAADMAGTLRMKYPPNIRPIRVMCSSSVDPVYILKAFLSGADAVLIGGCPPGDCHYGSGNFKTRRRIAAMKEVLNTLGLEGDRLWIRWISAAEGRKFAETAIEITEEIKKIGPSKMAQCGFM